MLLNSVKLKIISLFLKTIELAWLFTLLFPLISSNLCRLISELWCNKDRISGTKRYTFETSHQVLTSIDTPRLTPCCSLLFVYC